MILLDFISFLQMLAIVYINKFFYHFTLNFNKFF